MNRFLASGSGCWVAILVSVLASPVRSQDVSDDVYDRLGLSNRDKLSAASRRALERNYDQGPEWYCAFRVHDLKGDLGYEEGVIRRDPSAVITVDRTFYVYYTRGDGETHGFGSGDPQEKFFPWDLTEVWYATSADGWDWKEQGRAVARGPAAPGLVRSLETDRGPLEGLKWGLCHQYDPSWQWQYIRRFESYLPHAP